MKANMPRSYEQLKPSEKQRIEAAIFDRLDEELCQAQFVWLKMACIILADLGMKADEITMFVANWKQMYRRNSRFKDKAAQDAYLNPRLDEIFGEGGYPEEFVESMKEIGR